MPPAACKREGPIRRMGGMSEAKFRQCIPAKQCGQVYDSKTGDRPLTAKDNYAMYVPATVSPP